jgi:hypothetical protein
MRSSFTYTTPAEPGAVRFDADRALVDRLRPPHPEEQRALGVTLAVYPNEDFPRLSVMDVRSGVESVSQVSTTHWGSFPERNNERTTSLAVIGGDPIRSYIGANGFVSYLKVETAAGDLNRVAFPH